MNLLPTFLGLMLRYVARCGVSLDMSINVLLGGQIDQTVSMRCALAQRAGQRWGCLACAALSRIVQRDHCQDQFDNTESPWWVYPRAAIAFGIGALAAYGIWRISHLTILIVVAAFIVLCGALWAIGVVCRLYRWWRREATR